MQRSLAGHSPRAHKESDMTVLSDLAHSTALKTKQFIIKVVKSNKGIKLTLMTLKSLRYLLQFMAIHNILVHFK